MGPLHIRQPRGDDRVNEQRFRSTILPNYLRRMPRVDNLIFCLYLKGICTGDFRGALRAILGQAGVEKSAAGCEKAGIGKGAQASWDAGYIRRQIFWTNC